MEAIRLEAQIARDLEAYQKRPKRRFIGARAEEYRFARYVEDWRMKVERVGNLNYPEAARAQKLYGSLILTVAIKADGSIEHILVDKSSGKKILDAAALRIVQLAAPYAAFPANIRRDTDILEITRTWTFTRGGEGIEVTADRRTDMAFAARWLVRIVAALVLVFVAVQAWFFAHVLWYKYHPPTETAFMQYRSSDLREKNPRYRLQYAWVDYDRISIHLKRALVAAEDSKFVEHEGFDWDGIQLAMEKNRMRGKTVAGGSTITQQLAKNLFLSPSKSWLRKAQEALITLMLETTLDKERILELYLNVIEWGSGVFGAEAAAQKYFGVHAAQISADQAARLAAMAPNPRFYERNQGAPGLQRKIGIIRARMTSAELP
jgi:monofunctional biosynthetic peptidoglycan transglycosylase